MTDATRTETTAALASPLRQLALVALVGAYLVGSCAQAAITEMLDLSDAAGLRGDIVTIQLTLSQPFGDFEGIDFEKPQFDPGTLALHQAPALGPALPPAWVFAPPTLAAPKLGVTNSNPGVESLGAGVLATYRFRILPTAPLGVTTVTIPYVLDEEAVLSPLAAEVTVIPEPASWALLAGGLLLVALASRRRPAQA